MRDTASEERIAESLRFARLLGWTLLRGPGHLPLLAALALLANLLGLRLALLALLATGVGLLARRRAALFGLGGSALRRVPLVGRLTR